MFIKIKEDIVNVKNIVKIKKAQSIKTLEGWRPALYVYLVSSDQPEVLDFESDLELGIKRSDIMYACDKARLKFLKFDDTLVNYNFITRIRPIISLNNSVIVLNCHNYQLQEKFECKETMYHRLDAVGNQLTLRGSRV